MKTIIVGGGRGCRAILDLAAEAFLRELELEIVAVVDINSNAPGIIYARQNNIKTYTDFSVANNELEYELVIELTGDDGITGELYKTIKPGIKIIDHTVARIFWDLINARTRQNRQLKRVEELEQRLYSFINSAQDWISMKNLDGVYLVVNPATARAFNLKADDFIGRKPEEILPPKLAATIKAHDKEVIESRRHHFYDEIIPIEGTDHHFQTIRFPLTNYNNEITGVCTIARDITKEIRLTEQLIQSEKLAALGKLAAGIAHEINNPLTGVLAYAEDLLETIPQDALYREDIKVIIHETLRCRDIVRNLLDFARQASPKLEEISPDTIIEQSLLLVSRLPQFKDIMIEKRINSDIPKILTDPQQLQQVILNLMLNAAEAMKQKGSIILGSDYNRKKNQIIISIEDTGPGIPENLIDKIFDPFFSTKGTNGLGLAVSWGIVERHGGIIEVDTAKSGGAIFKIILPAHF